MQLFEEIAADTGVDPESIVFLRHSEKDTKIVRSSIASIEKWTSIQPVDEPKYDYLKGCKPPIVLCVLTGNKIYGVFTVKGVVRTGKRSELAGERLNKSYEDRNRPDTESNLYDLEKIEPCSSRLKNKLVSGWHAVRVPLARFGDSIFDQLALAESKYN